VAELKKVCVAIKLLPYFTYNVEHNQALKGFQGSRKADLVQRIRKCLYQDYPTCLQPHAQALESIAAAPSPPQQPTHTATPASVMRTPAATGPVQGLAGRFGVANAAPTGGSASSQGNMPYAAFNGFQAQQVGAVIGNQLTGTAVGVNSIARNGHATPQAQWRLPGAAAAASTATNGMQPNWNGVGFTTPQGQASIPHFGNLNGWAAAGMPNAQMAAGIPQVLLNLPVPAAFSSSRPSTYIKQEGAYQDPDAVPQNPAEQGMLGHLQQMSFPDPREILIGYRSVQRKLGRPPNAEEVMIEIVSQREEAFEAQQMDEARLQSEQMRKTDAAQRRQQIQLELQLRMETSSVDLWRQNEQMFPNSWILNNFAALAVLKRFVHLSKSPLKSKLIELLKLERDARKWYRDMPQSYFSRVLAPRLTACTSQHALMMVVSNETETLTRIMYILSEQVGGVPKAFRDAHDAAASSSSSPQANENKKLAFNAMKVEDDVILVPIPAPCKAAKVATHSSPGRPHVAEIIDLC
jgi:hypothetical protein